ncbi:MAG: hypothetical protein SGPRY_007031 [Prymnesium sp.]
MSIQSITSDPSAPSECVLLSLARAREKSSAAVAKINEAHVKRQGLANQEKEKVCLLLDELYADAIKLSHEERV